MANHFCQEDVPNGLTINVVSENLSSQLYTLLFSSLSRQFSESKSQIYRVCNSRNTPVEETRNHKHRKTILLTCSSSDVKEEPYKF